jgi:hypothetical protein
MFNPSNKFPTKQDLKYHAREQIKRQCYFKRDHLPKLGYLFGLNGCLHLLTTSEGIND